jgi:stearoyl-CoA desaturase (Delta-9 desaturase)
MNEPTAVAITAGASGGLPQAPARVSTGVLITNITGVTLPFLGLVAVCITLWGWGFSWVDFGLLLGMYFLSAVGITVGFHRLFTHRAFETNRAVQFILAVLGSMAVQGPLLSWVAQHRRHHQLSDAPGDPHSPHLHGHGLRGFFGGLWHAHMGWFFIADAPELANYIKDLRQSSSLRLASALFPLWVCISLLIPTALGALLTGTWQGALCGLLWGGLARIFLVHHVTWSINSVCHLWGSRPYPTNDCSRNNFLFGIFALGEGWHNNHHAFPTSARHGLRWWQIDVSYWVIRALAHLGLAWQVKLPASRQLSNQPRRFRRREDDRSAAMPTVRLVQLSDSES